jgi:hypothetical protein
MVRHSVTSVRSARGRGGKVTIPVTMGMRDGRLRVIWLRAVPKDFGSDAFFDTTAERLLRLAVRRAATETDVEELAHQPRSAEDVLPTGFIFHASRCGSTLLSRVLAEIPGSAVLREPEVPIALIAQLTRSPDKAELYLPAVRASLVILRRLARKGSPCFVKFFSGNVHHIGAIRTACPNVPEIFLYRHPVEVIVANLTQPFKRWLGDELITGLKLEQAVECSPAELLARAVGRKMAAMVQAYDRDRTLLVNYCKLEPSVVQRVLQFFNVESDEALIQRMQSVFALDAKSPSRRFVPDARTRREAASEHIRKLAERFAMSHYLALEALREDQGA